MATVIFTEGQLAKRLADTGWPSTVRLAMSTKPCSGGGAHTAGETYAGADWGEISGSGWYTAGGEVVNEPVAGSDGTKAWPTASWSTGAYSNGPPSVLSMVVIDDVDDKLLVAIDLSADRDLSLPNTTLNYDLTTTSQVS